MTSFNLFSEALGGKMPTLLPTSAVLPWSCKGLDFCTFHPDSIPISSPGNLLNGAVLTTPSPKATHEQH